jgi:hypothetical protein
VKTGTLPEVPDPVTVCAATLADANAKPKPRHMYADLLIFPNSSFPSFADRARRPRKLLSVRLPAQNSSMRDEAQKEGNELQSYH